MHTASGKSSFGKVPIGRKLRYTRTNSGRKVRQVAVSYVRYGFPIILASCEDKRSVSTDIEHFALAGARREGEIGKIGWVGIAMVEWMMGRMIGDVS